ncbi:MAG: hypothetical protein ACRDVE_20250 [Actinocrinis sp.]
MPGTGAPVPRFTSPISSSVSAATGSGRPYASTAPVEPLNQVITTLESVTVATSTSRTSKPVESARAAGSATSGAAAIRPLHSSAWRRVDPVPQRSMAESIYPPSLRVVNNGLRGVCGPWRAARTSTHGRACVGQARPLAHSTEIEGRRAAE